MTVQWYNNFRVINVSAKVEKLIDEIQKLNAEEIRVLYHALLRKMAVPLNNPEKIYDDWNDTEVDAAYAENR